MSSRFLNRTDRQDGGFTLLEVMIAMVIMVFLSIAIYQLTTETYRLRDTLTVEGDFYNEIRLSMNIVQRDIALIYSPLLIAPPKPSPTPGQTAPSPSDARDMDFIMSSDLGQNTQFWLAAADKTAIRASRFQGTDSKMSFVAVSHTRVYKDAPESDFSKISYELQPDKNGAVADTMVLIKSASPNAFETEDSRDKAFVKFPLLHGIKKLSYRYYRKDRDRWGNSWDSEKEDFKDRYPDIVEIRVEVVGPSRLSFEGVFQFRPEVPLNGIDPST